MADKNIQAYTPEELYNYTRDQLQELESARLEITSPALLAQYLERFDVDQQRLVLRKVNIELASDILAEMHEESAADILTAMREHRAIEILDEFEPDDAADIVAELEDIHRDRLLEGMEPLSRENLQTLLEFDPDTAGGIMTVEVDTAYDDMTVDEAIERIREFADRHEDLHYVYVIDRHRHLKGTVSLRKLIQAKGDDKVSSVMRSDIRGICNPGLDKEHVALMMAEYNIPDLAVVDEHGILLGVVTHDDVLDVVQDEATEDLQILVGAGGDESVNDDIGYSVRKRQPWLGFNLVTAFLASAVVLIFKDQIEAMPILAAFMPIIAGLGGNSGQQTLAVAIRSIALGEFSLGDEGLVLLRQAAIGIINGACIGLLAAGIVWILQDDPMLSLIVFLAMILNMALAGLAGAFIPVFLRRLNRDPAQSSSILLTAVTDTGGFFIFLGLGTLLIL